MSAERFIKEHQANREIHGKHTVTPEELHWINIARAKLGSLAKLGEGPGVPKLDDFELL